MSFFLKILIWTLNNGHVNCSKCENYRYPTVNIYKNHPYGLGNFMINDKRLINQNPKPLKQIHLIKKRPRNLKTR